MTGRELGRPSIRNVTDARYLSAYENLTAPDKK